MDFKDKVCLVTGGASGIGKSFVECFLKRGSKCLFVDIQHQAGEALSKTWKEDFGSDRVEFFRVDITSHANFEAAFEKCFEIFGGLDIVVNNAGVNGEINWESQLQITLFGTIRGTKLALKYMGKNEYGCGTSTRKGGVVLNISSIHSLLSWPILPVYSAAKAGITKFTRCMGHQAEYVNHGVKIVCLCPNGVNTPSFDYLPYVGITKAGYDFMDTLEIEDGILTPEEVGEAGLNIIDEGESGSVWYIHKHGIKAFEVPNEDSWENLLKHNKK